LIGQIQVEEQEIGEIALEETQGVRGAGANLSLHAGLLQMHGDDSSPALLHPR
jgi:hypothetical protein